MNSQLPLLELQPLIEAQVAREATIQQRFEAFHAANPQVYAALRSLALQMVGGGVRSYGIKGLFELLRWQYAIQTKGEPYRLCNSYTSRYARLLMQREPALRGFFEVRALRERGCEVSE